MTNQTTAGSFRRSNTYAMTMTALMTAVTCILAPLSIPIGPVMLTLQMFAVMFAIMVLTPKQCMEKRDNQLFHLFTARLCRTSCLFRFYRWRCQARRTNRRLHSRLYPDGNHCRICD